MAIIWPEGTQHEPSKILQAQIYHSGNRYASVSQINPNANNHTTSNTTSVWTASFTPIVSTSKLIGVYTSQEDAQGNGGWTCHTCFIGGTFRGGSVRYMRNVAEEPYTQAYQFEYDHNTTSAITLDMRYCSTAGIYIILGRTYNYTHNTSRWYGNATSLTVYEVSTT